MQAPIVPVRCGVNWDLKAGAVSTRLFHFSKIFNVSPQQGWPLPSTKSNSKQVYDVAERCSRRTHGNRKQEPNAGIEKRSLDPQDGDRSRHDQSLQREAGARRRDLLRAVQLWVRPARR